MSKIRKKSAPRKSSPKPAPSSDAEIAAAILEMNRNDLERLGLNTSYGDIEQAARFAKSDAARVLLQNLQWFERSAEKNYEPNTWPEDRHANAMRIVNQAGLLMLCALDKIHRDNQLDIAAALACASPSVRLDAERLLDDIANEFDVCAEAAGYQWPEGGAA